MLDFSGLDKLERDAFVGVVKYLVDGDFAYLDVADLRGASIAGVPRPFLKMALTLLAAKGFLDVHFKDEEPDSFEIHPDIISDTHLFVEAGYEVPAAAQNDEIPAADRFVPINHNSPGHREADEALEQIEAQLTGNNELFADADQRLAVVREVHGIREALQERFIRVQVLLTYVQGPLTWLASQFFSGVIRTLAGKVITYLTGLM
jgi:hypothetical protein